MFLIEKSIDFNWLNDIFLTIISPLRVGIIGLGGIANGTHIPGYLTSTDCDIVALCDIDEGALKRGAKRCNIPKEHCFNDYKDLIASDFVDVVDICTPNYLHCKIAKEAINAGKAFSIEKPVGMNYSEAKEVMDMAEHAKIPAFVCFSWRYRQYTRFVKSLVDKGKIGYLYHIYIRCIKNSGLWQGRKLEWRFDNDKAGSGVLGDLGSHMMDITRFLGQEFKSVIADSGIIVKERQKIDSDEIAPVTTDDWCNIIAKLESGVGATINLSRCATTIDDLIEFELFGKNGSIKYTYENGVQSIEICTGETDMIGKGKHKITPPASFEAVQSQSFINLVNGKSDEYTARIIEGIKCQAVIDAAIKSIETKRYVDISEITEAK